MRTGFHRSFFYDRMELSVFVMRIIISSLTYPLLNGVTVSINTSVDELLKRGHEARIVAPDYKKGKVRPEHVLIPSSLLIHKVAVNLLGKEERVFRAGSEKRVAKAAEEFGPDIYWLHSVTWAPNAFENHMLKSGKPKVLFYHTLVEEYGRIYAGSPGAYVMRKRTKALGNKMDIIMTPSKMMKRKLEKYGVKVPIRVIPTGIRMPERSFTKKEVRERFGIPPKKKILLYLGRLSTEKNLELLLEALKEVRKKEKEAVLLLVGPGDIEDIKKQADKMGIGESVFCPGPLEKKEARRVYGGCDIFVFSSQTETQGLVVGEAMLAGLPVVALRSPVQKEIYPEGRSIVVKKKKNFADNVVRLLLDDDKRKRIAKKGKEYAEERFSVEKMAESHLKVFEEVIKKQNKRK